MSRSKFGSALAASAAIFASTLGPAFAADPEDTLVVTGRFATKETASSVTIVTAEDIERRQMTSVYEALRGAPGVSRNQSGGAGQVATVRLRGATSGQTLTLIDGIPVNDTTSTSGYNFAFLDSGVVERIEILRGAGSAIWGSDALGGVINIVTYEPGENAVKAYAESGSFSTGRLGARATQSLGPVTLSGYATAFKTSGISAADERDGYTEKDGADSVTLGGRALWNVGGGFSFQYGARTTQGHSDFDEDTTFSSPTGNGDAADFYHSRENLNDAKLTWAGETMKFDLSGSQSLTKTSSVSELFGPFRVRAERRQVRATGELKISSAQTFLVGAERSKLIAETSFAGKSDVSTTAGFATYQGRFLDKLLLEAGLRYEDDERHGGESTGRLGAALDVWRGGVLRATLGSAFRAPTVFETNGLPFKLPNPDLKPEKSTEWEIGAEQKLFDDALTLGLVYFDRGTKDLITGTGFPTFVNLPRADSKGVELTADGAIGAFDLGFAYTYNEATNRSTGRQLDRIPETIASLDLTYRATDRLSFGGALIWNGEESDQNFGTFPATPVVLESWTTLDLRAAYRVNDQVEIYGRVENALDADYQDAFSYGTPRRAAYIGLRAKS